MMGIGVLFECAQILLFQWLSFVPGKCVGPSSIFIPRTWYFSFFLPSALPNERASDGLYRCDPESELPRKLSPVPDLLLAGESATRLQHLPHSGVLSQ